jgi:hypothetical protein
MTRGGSNSKIIWSSWEKLSTRREVLAAVDLSVPLLYPQKGLTPDPVVSPFRTNIISPLNRKVLQVAS